MEENSRENIELPPLNSTMAVHHDSETDHNIWCLHLHNRRNKLTSMLAIEVKPYTPPSSVGHSCEKGMSANGKYWPREITNKMRKEVADCMELL